MAILNGIRVVEIAGGLACPVAALLLAELGAEVVRIEPPGGDPDRGTARFAVWNRSKTCCELDLDEQAGRSTLSNLLLGADVLLHDKTPLEAGRIGLTDATLRARFPHLIAASVTGYPAKHPMVEIAGVDVLVLAEARILDEQACVARDGPIFLRFPLGSWGAAYLAAIGVLARLISRDRGHSAGSFSTSLLQGALVPMMMHWFRAERPTQSLLNGLPKHFTPSLFECADGIWIHILSNADHVRQMPEGLAALPESDRVPCAPTDPIRKLFPLLEANRKVFRTRPAGEWLEILWAEDVAVQPALPMGRLYDDPQVLANGYAVSVNDPIWGVTRQPGAPFTVTPPPCVRGPAPARAGRPPDWHAKRPADPAPQAEAGETRRLPLQGIKILDFGNFLAGPFAPMLAADLGADIIKVEATSGDQMRWIEWGFNACQRGKRSVALQLKDPRARRVLRRLVARADIVHHNLRMPAARKLGLAYEDLREFNPKLIYCHVSSYGPEGPRKDWPGYDQLFQASSGWEVEGAGRGNPPMYHRFGMMDHQCAMASLVATLAALYHRDRTSEGQFVTASLLGASLLTASETIALHDGTLSPYDRLDADQTGIAPHHRLYRCNDGWIALVAKLPASWQNLTDAVGSTDPDAIVTAFAATPVAAALALLERCGVACVRVRTNQGRAFFDDTANLAAGLVARYPHPVYGTLEQIGSFWDFGDAALNLTQAPPCLGEHSEEILLELGFSGREIIELLADGTVKASDKSRQDVLF